MNILAIDSTGNKTSVASKIGDDLLSLSIHHNRKDRPDWQSLLEKISISSDDLQSIDLFTFGQGPGSYTSIRSVATFLKAIALIHQKPLIPLSNLECIAYGHSLLYKNDSIIHSAISSDIDSEIYYSSYELKNSLLTALKS
jgi:tRNA A37 threonylcarbamoyladenosine modification protein TsaB